MGILEPVPGEGARADAVRRPDTLTGHVSRRRVAAGTAFFVVATAILFAPVTVHFTTKVLQGPNDATLMITWYRSLERSGENPWTSDRNRFVGAPEGIKLAPSVQWIAPVQSGVIWTLKPALGIVGAYNAFLFGGMALTGLSLFLLVSRLGYHWLPAGLAGTVFAFSPWAIERALAGHAAFLQGWIFVVLLYTLLRVSEQRTLRAAALAGIAFGGSFLIASYFGLLASLIVGTYFVYELVRVKPFTERLWTLSLACIGLAVTVLLLTPGLVAYARDHQTVERTFSQGGIERQRLGAEAASYLLPAPRHPLLGEITRSLPKSENFAEQTLFFGYTTMALALAGVVLLWRRDGQLMAPALRHRALLLASILLPVAFWASLRRIYDVFGIPIPTLSFFLGEVTNQFRVFARFGLIVGLALLLLTAPALQKLLARGRAGFAAAVGLCLVIGFELFPGRIVAWNASVAPPFVRWLEKQPPGIAVHYPLPTDQEPAIHLGERVVFYQSFHGHPIYNIFGSGIGDTREDGIRILSRYVTDPLTPGILAAEGVRYVFLHDDVYRTQAEDPPTPGPEFTLAARFKNVRAYRLKPDVPPADLGSLLEQNAAGIAAVQGLESPALQYSEGFSTPSAGHGSRRFRGEGVIQLAHEDPNLKRIQLILRAQTDETITLQIIRDDGSLAAQASLPPGDAQVTVGPFALPYGRSRYLVRAVTASGATKLLRLSPIVVQPLADFSISLRDT